MARANRYPTTRRKRSQRWTAAKAQEVIAEWKQSGQSMTVFCQQRGIQPERLGRWRRRLAQTSAPQEKGKELAAGGWVEAVISGAGASIGSTAVVVQLRSGDRIEIAVPTRVDAAWLSKLVCGLAEQR